MSEVSRDDTGHETVERIWYHPEKGMTILWGSAAVADMHRQPMRVGGTAIELSLKFDNHDLGRLTTARFGPSHEVGVPSLSAWREIRGLVGPHLTDVIKSISKGEGPQELRDTQVEIDGQTQENRIRYHETIRPF